MFRFYQSSNCREWISKRAIIRLKTQFTPLPCIWNIFNLFADICFYLITHPLFALINSNINTKSHHHDVSIKKCRDGMRYKWEQGSPRDSSSCIYHPLDFPTKIVTFLIAKLSPLFPDFSQIRIDEVHSTARKWFFSVIMHCSFLFLSW
jgi:hypothetical protein